MFLSKLLSLTFLTTSVFAEEVKVDLQPCIFASDTIQKDVGHVSESYMTSLFFDGFWASSKLTPSVTTGTLDLTNNDSHGKCNVIFIGFPPTTAQKEQLQQYSIKFKVRLIYFNNSETANDPEVNTRLSISQYYAEPLTSAYGTKMTPGHSPRIVKDDLQTEMTLFFRPVHIYGSGSLGTSTVVAEYVDENGSPLLSGASLPSASMVTYVSDSGFEELHVFFSMAWFDVSSWAWLHYLVEWGTKGVFQGERRFHLGGVVDDLFLGTNVFEYDGGSNEVPEVRISESDMNKFQAAENSLNSKYKSSIVTEFAFNGLGILEKTQSPYVIEIANADAALLPKGDSPINGGLPDIHPVNWLSDSISGMQSDFTNGLWDSDDLLGWFLDNMGVFHMQGHSLTHMARDNLGTNDCKIEDTGNTQIAVLTGLFNDDSYSWRSMTNPGITGLFNPNCLTTAMDDLLVAGPGDNTYDGVQTSVSLISSVSPYHSIYTTTSTNGVSGFQIVPRFATNVYFNCQTADCLVQENEVIRRTSCGCENVDPSQPMGSCSLCGDIESFGSVDALYDWEAETASRNLLSGRRDKYMFHQANVIPTSDLSGESTMQYWYEEVLLKLDSLIDFPVTSMKFDDLAENFKQHENLDSSGALFTVTLDNVSGDISEIVLASGAIGYIPLTIPDGLNLPTSGLIVGSTEVYGSDKTYYVSTSTALIPEKAVAPGLGELSTW